MYKFPIDISDDTHETNAYLDRWGDKMIVESRVDMEPYLHINREARKDNLKPFGRMRRVAHLPPVIVEKLMRDGIWNDRVRFRKWLNSSEQVVFRTNNEVL